MIELPTKIYNQIRQVQKADHVDMQDVMFVIHYMHSVKCDEAAEWIQANSIKYLQGLLEGFCVDNSQNQQIRDIHYGA